MHVSYGAKDHSPRNTEEPRGYNAMGNVRRKDTRRIRSNYRSLERDKDVRERVEVSAPPAPGVGQAHIGALAKTIIAGDVTVAILCNSRVLQSQQSVSSGGIE